MHGFTNKRNSEGRNSVFIRNSVRESVRSELYSSWRTMVCGELWFAGGGGGGGANLFAVANCVAIFLKMFGELVRQNLRSPQTIVRFLPANEFSGKPFASSWRSMGKLGRTRVNSAKLRRTFSVLRRTLAAVQQGVGVSEPLASLHGVCPS